MTTTQVINQTLWQEFRESINKAYAAAKNDEDATCLRDYAENISWSDDLQKLLDEEHTVKPWEHPRDYIGATWEGWYSAGFGQSRDSDVLEASNFQVAYNTLKTLNTDFEDETTVRIIRNNLEVAL